MIRTPPRRPRGCGTSPGCQRPRSSPGGDERAVGGLEWRQGDASKRRIPRELPSAGETDSQRFRGSQPRLRARQLPAGTARRRARPEHGGVLVGLAATMVMKVSSPAASSRGSLFAVVSGIRYSVSRRNWPDFGVAQVVAPSHMSPRPTARQRQHAVHRKQERAHLPA